jgi:hypothetical protein
MFFNRWNISFARAFVAVLCGAFLCLTWPDASSADGVVREGASTSSEAAQVDLPVGKIGLFRVVDWRPAPAFLSASAFADTTDLEFPEEEEERSKNLVRDVGIFIVASAMVAYFIIKVFLEGDTEQPPEDDNGKEIP